MSVATVEQFEMLDRLDKDLKTAAKHMGKKQARYMVDMYYQIQDFRIQAGGQERASGDDGEPNRLVTWFHENMRRLEGDTKLALNAFVKEYTVGRWLQSICGIGPVISAGLLAHLDISRAQTVGHFWRFAGLDPTNQWLGSDEARRVVNEVCPKGPLTPDQMREACSRMGRSHDSIAQSLAEELTDSVEYPRDKLVKALARRPWNARLKTLCAFKIGESFVKVQGRDSDFYGTLFAERKAAEWQRNLEGKLASEAQRAMANKRFDRSTNAYQWYSGGVSPEWAKSIWDAGNSFPATLPAESKQANGHLVQMLPPAHIHARARRWAVKLFLSHLHYVMYWDWFEKEPPKPYIIEHPNGADHRHIVPAPNWPVDKPARGLKEMGE